LFCFVVSIIVWMICKCCMCIHYYKSGV
jgi:hypothetical protein